MLQEKGKTCELSTEEYDVIKRQMAVELSVLQQQVIRDKIPVVMVFEGFSASGKGTAIASLILNFDPRGFTVYSTRAPQERELRKPWIARFGEQLPAYGRIAVFDRAWYSGMIQMNQNKKKPEQWIPYLEDINTFERQLADDGYVILKFFLHISEKEQKKRIKKLLADKDTAWRVTKADLEKLEHYHRNAKFYQKMLEMTDRPYAHWNVINAKHKNSTRAAVMQAVKEALQREIEKRRAVQDKSKDEAEPAAGVFALLPVRRIQEYTLDQTMEREEYERRMDQLQKKMRDLHNVIYRRKIPVVIGFEGNDAAGKGGSIKRVARALDPRGYAVQPIAAPTPEELSHHYLWRFYNRLPLTGHIAIFDRTWYGRVLVERVEGFTPQKRIAQAYGEINEFELMLHRWGAVVIKFWLAIDQEEQLKRFRQREDTPEKQWKITEEDWRNREKWDAYTEAVNDMLKYTNTVFAPWTVVESNSKYYARIKVLETILKAVGDKLELV